MLENHPQREKDYCPLSILPALSKEFEQFVLKQLISYIDELSLLTPSISCFRKGHSTVTALLGIRDEILRAMKRPGLPACRRLLKEIGGVCTQAMKRDEVRLMVFTDYSKAFNTVLRQY